LGKLWALTREQLSGDWRSERGTSATLCLNPKGPSLSDSIFLYPLLQQGSLLRTRVTMGAGTAADSLPEVERPLDAVLPSLPMLAAHLHIGSPS